MNILDRIVAATLERIKAEKKTPLPTATAPRPPFIFERSLRRNRMTFICEVKKASPSKGVIADEFPYVDIAKEYKNAGADAISVLTEPDFFMGSINHLSEIRAATDIPILRKDFIIDPFQIEQSARLGADAILLICAILTPSQLKEYIAEADRLGLSCLIETHNEAEIKTALDAGARIIGVNNRDLKTFGMDMNNSIRLRRCVPNNVIFVSESGIRTADDVDLLRSNGVDTVLIGETLMRSADKTAALESLRGQRRKEVMIKICGLRRDEDVVAVNNALPDYVGFVFTESKRQIGTEDAMRLRGKLDRRIRTVGVFVNQPIDLITELYSKRVIDVAQLHGDENDVYIKELRQACGCEIIKSVSITDRIPDLPGTADYLLFDTASELRGGTGRTFDWSILKNYHNPYFLAGGLSSDNVHDALHRISPFAVDVSSGVETDNFKDSEKINRFVQIVRSL